jgi:hypothetical protein
MFIFVVADHLKWSEIFWHFCAMTFPIDAIPAMAFRRWMRGRMERAFHEILGCHWFGSFSCFVKIECTQPFFVINHAMSVTHIPADVVPNNFRIRFPIAVRQRFGIKQVSSDEKGIKTACNGNKGIAMFFRNHCECLK